MFYMNIALFLYGFINALGFQADSRYAFEPQVVSTEIKEFIFHIQTRSGLVLFTPLRRVGGGVHSHCHLLPESLPPASVPPPGPNLTGIQDPTQSGSIPSFFLEQTMSGPQ